MITTIYMPKKQLILVLFSLFALSACSLLYSPDGTSGIEGHVEIGPSCPGPVHLGDTTCQNKPYQAKITILDENKHRITQFTTDVNGYFKVSLNPGTYIIHPEQGDPLPVAGDQTTQVLENQFSDVNILYDSGMR